MITPSSRSPGDDSTRRSLPPGLLSFGLGAAVMMLALGINGFLAGAVSRYDPTWVYVMAVALVAWFEGWMPALVAGAAALTAYELWFSRGPVTAGSLAEPALSSLAAIVIVALARRAVGKRLSAEASKTTPSSVAESRGPRDDPSLLARELAGRGHPQEADSLQVADAAELRTQREAVLRLREELARVQAERDALQSSMQAAMLRHQEESSKLKVDRARGAEEARAATEALSLARGSLGRLEGELTAQRRAAEEAQRLAEERAAAMLDGEARHGADETRLRDALDEEKVRGTQAAARIDSMAQDLGLATVERDRWQVATAEIREEAQRRIGEVSDQYAAASAAARAADEELERERDRYAVAQASIADAEAAAERAENELAAMRRAVEHSAAERDRLAGQLQAAGQEIDHWHQEYSRSADDVAHASASLSELSFVQSTLEQLRIEHGHVTRSLESSQLESDQLRAERAELSRQLAAAAETLAEVTGMRSAAEELRAENAGLGRLLQIARAQAENAESANARLIEETEALAPLRSEVERLEGAHATAIRLLEEARADAENALLRGEEFAIGLARATAELAMLSTLRSEAEHLREEQGELSRMLEETRAEADDAREEAQRIGEQLARATAEIVALSAVRSEGEQLRNEQGNLGRMLEETRVDAENAREEAGRIGEELTRATAEIAALSAVTSEVEQLRDEQGKVSRMLEAARVEVESAREEAGRIGEELSRATAEIAALTAVKAEAEQLRLEKIALVQAVDSTKTERDTAQARAALAADEIAAGSETRAALNQSIGIVEQLQSENRRLTTALGVAGREAARLQADSTHYADEVIGLRSRLARVSAAPPETDALREEITRLTGELEEAQGRSDSIARGQLLSEERSHAEATRLLAEFERERKGLREALDSAARINVELTGHKEDSERWQAEAQRLAAQIEAAMQTAAEISAEGEEERRRARHDLELEWTAKLDASTAVLAERQREIDNRQSLLKEAQAQLQSAAGQIEALREELASAQAAQATLDDETHHREMMTAAVAASASSAAGRIVELEGELSRVRDTLADAGRESLETLAALEDQRRTFADAEKAWDEKLLRIVEGMTTDHENDLGEAMIEREAAKAELRVATNQIARLEASLREAEVARDDVELEWKRRGEQVLAAIVQRESTIRAAAEREVARLRVELESRVDAHQKLEEAAAEEKHRYEEAESSWGNRLQQIVANVTDDYEADLGEAITIREGARAELRSMAIDFRKSQEKLAAAEEMQRALIGEAARRDAEIERLSAAMTRDAASAESQADGGALQKKLQQAEQINSAWGSAFAERESELRREAEARMAEAQAQLERLRKSELGLTEAFRAAAADAETLRRGLEEERVASVAAAANRDEAFRQGLLHAQQQWEDRFDAVVAEAEEKHEQLRMKIVEQEGELAALRAGDLEQRARREQEESEELLIARQLELSQQSDEERRVRSEVLRFAEDARNLLMGGTPEPVPSSEAQGDPFPEAAADLTAPAGSADDRATSPSDDFLAIVTRLGGNS